MSININRYARREDIIELTEHNNEPLICSWNPVSIKLWRASMTRDGISITIAELKTLVEAICEADNLLEQP